MLLSDAFPSLQTHTLERADSLGLPKTARDLRDELRTMLLKASDDHTIRTTPAQILGGHLSLLEPPQRVDKALREAGIDQGAKCIFGGEKNQDREVALAHFMRDDAAWFDFSITVRQTPGGLELLAYDFEIRAVPNVAAPFLRFDLNLPAHRNEQRELRCHVHPGSDDVLIPAPLLGPIELLHLFLNGLRVGRRAARLRSSFELAWLRQMVSTASDGAYLSREPST
jgi:hypothetical protein